DAQNPLKPMIYDRFTQASGGTPLLNTAVYPNPSAALASVLQSGAVYFSGTNANVPDATRPELFAPSPFQGGSSYSHLDEDLYPPGTINSLMTPYGDPAEANHTPGPVALCLFEDMGWVTPQSCSSPPNDAFSAAQVLTGGSGTVTGTNIGATEEAGEPNHADTEGGRSVWYRWTAPGNGTVTFDTIGSSFDDIGGVFDTVLAVYTGNSVGALSLVDSNDDIDNSNFIYTSRVGPIDVTGGVTYRIAVDGYKESGLPPATGTVQLNWSSSFPDGGGAANDFDGDGDTDRAVYRNGAWYADGQATAFHGLGTDIPVPGDYDADGDTDRAVFRSGAWYVAGQPTVYFGLANDIPVPGDYDGDGDTDRAVYRNGAWLVDGQAAVFFGLANDLPVPGDYDGDGDTDRAVYRNGSWFVSGGATVAHGLANDIPVPADYDGDGDDDMAVYRASVGGWYVNGQATVFHGLSADIPVPGDYDGDGDADRAVWRSSVGGWYVSGQPTVFLGLNGDIPVPLPQAIYRRFFPGV
ncbi:MAG: hypothetical protein LC708_00530, partial [Actinobacteria bacterium]|nr:hypothetical protein [Actinomycetota bacterium]